MTVGILIAFATHLVVPLLFAWGLWRGGHKSKASWLAATLGSAFYVSFFAFAGGGWQVVGYWLRFALPVLFAVAVFSSFRRVWRSGAPWWRRPGPGGWAAMAAYALVAAIFGLSWAAVLPGLSYGDARAAQLSFPLEGGPWLVVHGGNSPALNYHNVDRAQRYAVDVVGLNALGVRASGLSPTEPERYEAFGATIVSPCAGEVIESQDGLPDHRPSGTDRRNPAGNHVVVRCAGADRGVDVVLAHMERGSVAVERGQRVGEGQPLGRLGNSGNSTEPHLHVHAVRTGSGSVLRGEGVSVEFGGRFLVRGSLVF